MPSGRLMEIRSVNHYVLSLNMGLMKILAAHANRQIESRHWSSIMQFQILLLSCFFFIVKRICLMNKDTNPTYFRCEPQNLDLATIMS